MTPRVLRAAVAAVALAGAGVASYLVYARYAGVALLCTGGGCEAVQHSRYATLAGVPVAALGLLAYLLVFVTALFRTELARATGVATALAGVIFGAYLVYVQLALIHRICEWCLASDALMTVLAALAILRVLVEPVTEPAGGASSRRRARAPSPRARRRPPAPGPRRPRRA